MGCYMKIDGDTLEVDKCFSSLRALAGLKQLVEAERQFLDCNTLKVVDHGVWFAVDVMFWGQVAYSTAAEFESALLELGPWTRQPTRFRSWAEDFDEWGEFWVASSADVQSMAASQSKMSQMVHEAGTLLPGHLDELIKHLQSIRSKRKREATKAALEAKTCPVN